MWFNILKLEPHNKVYQKRVIEVLNRKLSPLLTSYFRPDIVTELWEESESDYDSERENAGDEGPHRAADITGMYIDGYTDIKLFKEGVIRLRIQGKYFFDSSRDYAFPKFDLEHVSKNNYLYVNFADSVEPAPEVIPSKLGYSLRKYDLDDIPQMIKKIEREIINIGRDWQNDKISLENKLLGTLEGFNLNPEKIFYRGFKLTTMKL